MTNDVTDHVFFRDRSGAGVRRLIDPVLDCRRAGAPVQVPAANVLDGLKAEGVSNLRISTSEAYRAGNPMFRCVACGGALYVSTRGMTRSGTSGGLACFFAHHTSVSSARCPMSREMGRDPDEIDRVRFHGQQEGRRHRFLKLGLKRMLDADPAFSGVVSEGIVRHGAAWCRPDVSARHGGRGVASRCSLPRRR